VYFVQFGCLAGSYAVTRFVGVFVRFHAPLHTQVRTTFRRALIATIRIKSTRPLFSSRALAIAGYLGWHNRRSSGCSSTQTTGAHIRENSQVYIHEAWSDRLRPRTSAKALVPHP
jgi:hypothetical protein